MKNFCNAETSKKLNYFERNRDQRYLQALECCFPPFVFVSFFGGPRAAGEIKFRNSPITPQKYIHIIPPDFISCVTWFGTSLAHDSFWLPCFGPYDLGSLAFSFDFSMETHTIAIGLYICNDMSSLPQNVAFIYSSIFSATFLGNCRLAFYLIRHPNCVRVWVLVFRLINDHGLFMAWGHLVFIVWRKAILAKPNAAICGLVFIRSLLGSVNPDCS